MPDLFGNDDENHRILIDGRWDLEDLYRFPRAYEQVYFALYSMHLHDGEDIPRMQRAYSSMPWQGGYSAVNFYAILKRHTPRKDRPIVRSIQYASPGWIELGTIAVGVAITLGHIIKSICKSIDYANNTYTNIHRGLSERRMLGITVEKAEIELAKKYASFIKQSNTEMADIFQIDDVQKINRITGSELKTLKIFLSMYRRIKILCDFQLKKKINL